jgi:hypothetical protein
MKYEQPSKDHQPDKNQKPKTIPNDSQRIPNTCCAIQGVEHRRLQIPRSVKSDLKNVDLSTWLFAHHCLSNWLHKVPASKLGDQVLESHQ